ncbi:unnamed protein product [Ectocarpus sp. CCAP 1310/34]|nr:unnamed protein product [Ectocarpus sp. CCAP 1310/34]
MMAASSVTARARTTAAPSLALLLLLLLGSERYTPSCLGFSLSVAPTSAVRSPAARPVTAPVGRYGKSSSSCRVDVSCVRGRTCSALAAFGEGEGEGSSAGPSAGGSGDIFDALMAGDMDFVTKYVEAGGDCSVQDSIGDTPLMLAVENELTPAVRMLIKEGGANANLASKTTGETPLMLAAYYGHTNLARVLVTEGDAELELRNNKGDTALSLACFWGNEDAVEYLLNAGADPNSRNDAGERPGDSFDSVFVPQVVENFFTADEDNERASAAGQEDIMFDDDDEEDIMFEELDEKDANLQEGDDKDVRVDGGEEKEPAEKEDASLAGEKGGDGEPEEEVLGPRENILKMLEEARAEAALEAN